MPSTQFFIESASVQFVPASTIPNRVYSNAMIDRNLEMNAAECKFSEAFISN